MKVYILSMQQVNNYGSVLQAYSLKKMIESLGNEVRFLAIEKGTDDALSIQLSVIHISGTPRRTPA